MVTKKAQICDQLKECEESGRKRLYMLGSRAPKLVTENGLRSPSSNAIIQDNAVFGRGFVVKKNLKLVIQAVTKQISIR